MTLLRFVEAQEGVYPSALTEIRAGRKTSHWMWFIWPQLRVLGRSHNAIFYGITDLEEANAYLGHATLGARLLEISEAMLSHRGMQPEHVLGKVDAMKLRSSMTLFAQPSGGPSLFDEVLQVFYAGERCPLTQATLAGE